MKICLIALASMVFLVLPSTAPAQSNTTGFIFGHVATEGAVPIGKARISITHLKTGLNQETTSREDGRFRFSALPVGVYSITVEAEGFQPLGKSDLTVRVGTGTPVTLNLASLGEETLELEQVTVVGQRTAMVDVSSPETAANFNAETIDRLPLIREAGAVALLAPGTTENSRFGLTFGGASAGENAYFINGMDVTNFRNGLGGSTVPFEFYDQFQVKTGGYGAEFGRSTGGVVNAVTRRGGDSWHFGAGAYFEPDSLRESGNDVRNPPGAFGFFTPDYWLYQSGNEKEVLEGHAWASGPLVEDRLYIYAVITQRHEEGYRDSGSFEALGIESFAADGWEWNDTFWGVKFDWQINSRHLLEFTAFSDGVERETDQLDVNVLTSQLEKTGTGITKNGGETYILRYTGHPMPDFTLSALVGFSEYDRTDRSSADHIPVVFDNRDEATDPTPTDWINQRVGIAADERTMIRLDGEWYVGISHLLRFGTDLLRNQSDDEITYSGGVYWAYYDTPPSGVIQGVVVPEGVDQVARERIFFQGGGFEVENTAFYIEDHWQAIPNLLVYLGLRMETFDNRNAEGNTFVKMSNQLGPRLGFAWDIQSDGRSKLFGTAGRYHLPMPTIVNINLSGAQYFTEEWYEFQALRPNGLPETGQSIELRTYADGSVPDADSLLDNSLEPGYQDEFILGYEYEIKRGLLAGIRGIYRDFKQAIEDVDMSRALNDYAAQNGYDDVFFPLLSAYVLTNPGSDAHVRFDLDLDGVKEDIVLPASLIGIPEVDRTYKAIELFFRKEWDGTWSLGGSYTYAESRGNYEGWTRTDTGQADAALTASFDVPELMEGANGRLPNDRPHTVKLFGSWQLAERWKLSANYLYQSGAPVSALGTHPGLPTFVNEAFFTKGQVSPRGFYDRTDSINQLDLGLQFDLPVNWRQGRLQLRADVFNVFNSDSVTRVNEYSEFQDATPSPVFGYPNAFQNPRFVRLGARLDF